MALDFQQIAGEVTAKIVSVLTGYGKDAGSYARTEGEKIALSIKHIGEMFVAGEIGEEEARLMLDIQTRASRAVLLAVEGIGIIAAEQAINGAMSIIKDAVNTGLGFKLIP
jgi:hypothetical protein